MTTWFAEVTGKELKRPAENLDLSAPEDLCDELEC